MNQAVWNTHPVWYKLYMQHYKTVYRVNLLYCKILLKIIVTAVKIHSICYTYSHQSHLSGLKALQSWMSWIGLCVTYHHIYVDEVYSRSCVGKSLVWLKDFMPPSEAGMEYSHQPMFDQPKTKQQTCWHTLKVRWTVSVQDRETSGIANCCTALMLSAVSTTLIGTVAEPSFFSFVDPRCHSCNTSRHNKPDTVSTAAVSYIHAVDSEQFRRDLKTYLFAGHSRR